MWRFAVEWLPNVLVSGFTAVIRVVDSSSIRVRQVVQNDFAGIIQHSGHESVNAKTVIRVTSELELLVDIGLMVVVFLMRLDICRLK